MLLTLSPWSPNSCRVSDSDVSEQAGGDLQLFQYFAEYQWDLIISCEGSNPITSFPYFSRKKKKWIFGDKC